MGTTETIDFIENRTFDEIGIGDSATLVRTLRQEDIQMFAIMSGDFNPTHVDPEYARSSDFREVVVSNSTICANLGNAISEGTTHVAAIGNRNAAIESRQYSTNGIEGSCGT